MKRSELQPADRRRPGYCRRCRKKSPRLLYRVESAGGVLIGKWCFECVSNLDQAEEGESDET